MHDDSIEKVWDLICFVYHRGGMSMHVDRKVKGKNSKGNEKLDCRRVVTTKMRTFFHTQQTQGTWAAKLFASCYNISIWLGIGKEDREHFKLTRGDPCETDLLSQHQWALSPDQTTSESLPHLRDQAQPFEMDRQMSTFHQYHLLQCGPWLY